MTNNDREAILEIHQRYNREANMTGDTVLLAELWDDDPTNVFFNLTGHNYRGLGHWSELWKYYGPRVEFDVPWTSFDTQVKIVGEVGWVTSLRAHRLKWTAQEDDPMGAPELKISRSTEVLVKKDGRWRVVHAHFSEASTDPRPGDI